MADKFNPKAIIEQMETRYQELAVKLEGFTAIQEEMTTLSRAIKVMKGERLGPGGPKGPRKSTQERAQRIIDAAEQEEQQPNGTRDAAYAFLKANPRGATIKQIGEAMARQGIPVNGSTVHNVLRQFRDKVAVIGTDTTSRGQQAKVYALKKGE